MRGEQPIQVRFQHHPSANDNGGDAARIADVDDRWVAAMSQRPGIRNLPEPFTIRLRRGCAPAATLTIASPLMVTVRFARTRLLATSTTLMPVMLTAGAC